MSSPPSSHPAPKDPASTSSGVPTDAFKPEQAPSASPNDADKGHPRSMWEQGAQRRQSWKREDLKHEMQMRATGTLGDADTGPGFSERK